MKKILYSVTALLLLIAMLIPAFALADGVTVNGAHDLTITAGGEKGSTTLTASCSTAGHISGFYWASDNPFVATVSDAGVVTAVGEGNCTIWVACKDDSDNERASHAIHVTQETAPIPTSVSFSAKPDTLQVGEQKNVTAAVTPAVEGTYTWSVGTGLSIVSGAGTPSIVIKGETAITGASVTVKFTPTNSQYLPSENTCIVKVTDVPVPDPVLSINAPVTTFTALNVTGTISSTVTNPGVGNWSFSAQLASGSSVKLNSITYDGLVTFTTVGNGTSVVQINATNDTTGRKLSASMPIMVELPPYLSLTANRSVLNSSHYTATATAVLHNPNSSYPENMAIYWSSSDTGVVRVVENSDYMKNGKATAKLYARSNGHAWITARNWEGNLIDTIYIEVSNYKPIPQTGPKMWVIAAEAGILLLVLAGAGVLYARKKKEQ